MGLSNKKVEEVYRKMMSQKTGEERALMGFSMFNFSVHIILSSIKEKTPPGELRRKIFLRLYRNDFDMDQQKKILKHLK